MNENSDIVLQQVIDSLCNAETTLMGPLLKLYYLGLKVKNDELATYALDEMNGYELKDLPEYRLVAATILVEIHSEHHITEKEVPVSMLEDGLSQVLYFTRGKLVNFYHQRIGISR